MLLIVVLVLVQVERLLEKRTRLLEEGCCHYPAIAVVIVIVIVIATATAIATAGVGAGARYSKYIHSSITNSS